MFSTGSCLIDPRIGEAGDIDTAMVVLRMPSSALCHIENSRRSIYGFEERIEAFGERGMLQTSSDIAAFPLQCRRYSARQDRRSLNKQSFGETLNAFVRDVEAGVPLEPNLADGIRAQLIAEAAVESLRTNRIVPIA